MMKYLKKYNESNSQSDLEFIITKIKENFPEEMVTDLFDNEVMEWVDEDWSDEYDSEYDWYIDHNNGEAQDVVISRLIDWYKSTNGDIEEGVELELIDRIKDEYSSLNY